MDTLLLNGLMLTIVKRIKLIFFFNNRNTTLVPSRKINFIYYFRKDVM